MLDGRPLVDAHLHTAPLPALTPARRQWLRDFGDRAGIEQVYGMAGAIDPARFDAFLANAGVDVALAFTEYDRKTTGSESAETVRLLITHGPGRFKLVANINPHLREAADRELRRQLDLGAVACRLHLERGGVAADSRWLYPAYEMCQAAGVPLVVQCGSANRTADPSLIADVLHDFRDLTVVFSHGGHEWRYDEAATSFAHRHDQVWIQLSGLPPSRLREHYSRRDWHHLAQKMIFGSDWPGVAGIAANARAVAALCPDERTAGLVLAGNANHVYRLNVNVGALEPVGSS